jgi:tetratricopeptide (TPR) repeat protein
VIARVLAAVAFVAGSPLAIARAQEDGKVSVGGEAPAPQATSSNVQALVAQLSAEDDAVRNRAIDAILALDEEALPDILARMRTYRRARVRSSVAYNALGAFRTAAGSDRADDDVDIVPGIRAVLARDRSPSIVRVAERRLIVRALENIGTPEAAELITNLFARDYDVWRWEARRVVFYMGPRALPMLIDARGHGSNDIRSWGRWGARHLGLSEPGRAVQVEDHGLLAEVLRAYGRIRDITAMPVVVSFVNHPKTQVREAAREAVTGYGQNAIWQLRTQYRNLTGSPANEAWNWERTAQAIYAAGDAMRLAPVRSDLEAGEAALAAGDLTDMERRFDAVLQREPELVGRERMGAGYAALGARAVGAGDLEDGARYYRRALRLAPNDPRASSWNAQVAYLEGEARLARGLLDVAAYEQAVALDPEHEGARALLADLEPSTIEGVAKSRWPYVVFAVLLLAGGVVLAWPKKKKQVAASAEPLDEATDEAIAAALAADDAARAPPPSPSGFAPDATQPGL